jgi:hypothetical protein
VVGLASYYWSSTGVFFTRTRCGFLSASDRSTSATPRKLATLEYGAGARAGVFYGLAAGFEASAFDLAAYQNGRARGAVLGIETATSRWNDGVPQSRIPVGDVRRRVLSDISFSAVRDLFPLTWADELEASLIQARWPCIHGDLHGSNALISEDGSAVLIDYGDVGDGPASLDPITLELSVIFHPQRLQLGDWPTIEDAINWGDLDIYTKNSPVAEFPRECRNWALRVSAGQREIAASAYAYLIRQLKYDDTSKDLILALLKGVKQYYDIT